MPSASAHPAGRPLSPADRIVVATDVRLVRLPDGAVGSTHPSLNDAYLERYTRTGKPTLLVARLTELGTYPVVTMLRDPRVEVVGLRGDSKSRFLPLRIGALARQVWKLPIRRTDTVVVRIPELVSSIVWARAKTAGATVVANVVADAAATDTAFGSLGAVMKLFVRTIERHIVRHSHAVIYVTRQWLQEEYPPRAGARTMGASNVVLPPGFIASRPRQYGNDELPSVHLVAVGSQNGLDKGHDILIRSVSRLRELGYSASVDLVGHGTSQPDLRQLAERLGVSAHVHFRGFVGDRRELAAVLDAADFFVMPSRTEGLPRAMIEAMARGLCSVGSAVGGIPELAPHDARFAPNEGSLVECIVALLKSPERATQIAAQQWHLAQEIAESAQPDRFSAFLSSLGTADA